MKHYFFVLFICLTLSGCGSKSYEQQAGLKPMPTPVAVAGAVVTPYPTPWPVRATDSGGKSGMGAIETSITGAITPAAADAIVAQNHMVIGLSSLFANPKDTYGEQRRKYIQDMMGYFERAAVIKRRQLEEGEQNDSTGEVAKYLNYARVCDANIATLPPVPPPY